MQLSTKHFGELEIEESKIIGFPVGLPGFPQCRNFILLNSNGEVLDGKTERSGKSAEDLYSDSFYWLQSTEDGDLAFVLLDIYSVKADYNPEFYDDPVTELGESQTGFLIYNIVVIPEEIENMTVNLKAPVVINFSNMTGRQLIVSNEEYHVRHRVLDEIINQKGGV